MQYTYQELVDLLVKKQQYIEKLLEHIDEMNNFIEERYITQVPKLPQEEP